MSNVTEKNYGFGNCRCGKYAVVKLNDEPVCLQHLNLKLDKLLSATRPHL